MESTKTPDSLLCPVNRTPYYFYLKIQSRVYWTRTDEKLFRKENIRYRPIRNTFIRKTDFSICFSVKLLNESEGTSWSWNKTLDISRRENFGWEPTKGKRYDEKKHSRVAITRWRQKALTARVKLCNWQRHPEGPWKLVYRNMRRRYRQSCDRWRKTQRKEKIQSTGTGKPKWNRRYRKFQSFLKKTVKYEEIPSSKKTLILIVLSKSYWRKRINHHENKYWIPGRKRGRMVEWY